MPESFCAEPDSSRQNQPEVRPSEAVLFVDDEAEILSAFERQLRTKFSVRTAVGSCEGLRAVERNGPFAVVVSDLRMPGMDGFQFLERVRSQSPGTSRIILTGHADLPTVIQAVNAGDILRFLQKPCSPEALEEGLQAGLRHYAWIVGERQSAEEAQQKLMEMHREIDISKATVACVETALEQSDLRFHATFDHAPVGICLLTSDGRIVESNDSFHRILGLTRDEWPDATLADWANWEDRQQVEECLERLVEGSQTSCQFAGSYRHDDGQISYVRITICRSPIPTRELLAIAMVEDISESRRLEK